MDAVTTNARGDACFALLLEQFPVHTGVVFAFLIDAQRGIESLHQVRIAVALTTVSRNVERLWFSQIALARIFRAFLSVRRRIAAVTIVAGQAARMMYVVIKEFSGRTESRIFQLCMTLDA